MDTPPKTIVIGSESFLGKSFYRAYCKFYPNTIGTHYQSTDSSRKIDLCAPDLSPLRLEKGVYSYALIAAANANLALCEKEKEFTYRRNVEGILQLCKLLCEYEIQPIFFSTAYVFDGVMGNYDEHSTTNPINEYGRQKEIVERQIEQVCGSNYLLIRCSKVFDLIKGGGALIDQICSPLLRKEKVRAAFDQVFCPIWVEDLVRAVFALQVKGCKGLYHLCGKEVWTRLDLAQAIACALSVSAQLIEPISLNEVQSVFKMPKRTNLRCEKLHHAIRFQEAPLSSLIKGLGDIYQRA